MSAITIKVPILEAIVSKELNISIKLKYTNREINKNVTITYLLVLNRLELYVK